MCALTKWLLVISLGVVATTCAEDVAQPTVKKEKVPFLPHVWVSGDLIYLKAQENGIAFSNRPQLIDTTSNFTTTRTTQPHFRWNSGVKIELGYQPKDWFFFANWTYVRNTAEGKKFTDGTAGFFPVLSLDHSLTPGDYVTSSSFAWRLNTHVVDAGTMISWRPTHRFILKTHGAFRLASLDQRYHANYGGGVFAEGMDNISMRNDFLGGGICVGIAPHLALPQGFSIVADVSISGLLGQFFAQQREQYLTQLLNHHTTRHFRFRGILDAKLALNWQREFLYKALVFSMQTGVTWHEFYRQNQLHFNDFHFFNDNRNLILRGGFVSLCLGF